MTSASSVKKPLNRARRVSVESGSPSVLPPSAKIVLAGNPNVGKSAIFNALTGLSADVSNYPGTTIDVSRGKLGVFDIIDTPGIYGVSSFNDEERIARNIIVDADVVVNVVSALSLDRDLFLTLQLIAMGKPLVLVINQWDEAEGRSIRIDLDLLSELLGVPVLPTVAVKGEGISDIQESLHGARLGKVPDELAELFENCSGEKQQALLLLALEGDEPAMALMQSPVPNKQQVIYRQRRKLVNEICEQTVQQEASRQSFSMRFGRFLLHPMYGAAISFAVCYLLFYQLLGVIVAGTVVDFTEKKCMVVYYQPSVRKAAATVFPCTITAGGKKFDFPSGTSHDAAHAAELEQTVAAGKIASPDVDYNFWSFKNAWALIGNALVGEYGVLTLTVTYLIGLLMPLVMGFYLGLSLLEDSGYLPRLAVLVDRLLNKIGLNGRAIIPLILGLGCVTMATVTTRLLTTTREKIIATVLLGVAIPCSAQLGIVSGTLAKAGGFLSWAVYGTIIGGMLALTGLVLHKLLPGKSQPLMIDLPPMRLPRASNVCKKTFTKSWNFMQESIPMFALAGLVVTVGQVTGLLDWFIHILQPITVSWLKLPNDPRIPTTFILGIVRRDFAAFGLTDVALSPVQAVVSMIVITLFVPCVATVGVMIKERGMPIALTIWFGSWLAAFVIGGILSQVLPPLFHAFGY
jgi:ferrous iron transport protein B